MSDRSDQHGAGQHGAGQHGAGQHGAGSPPEDSLSTANATPDSAPEAKKIGFAAALGFFLVVASTTTALYTGYLLFQGDPGNDVLNALPSDCEWVMVAEDSEELRSAAQDLARWHVLPTAIVAPLRAASRQLVADLVSAQDGLDPTAGLGLCRFRSASADAVPVAVENDKTDKNGVISTAKKGKSAATSGIVLSLGLRTDGAPGADPIAALQRVAARRVGLDPNGWTPGASVGGFVEYRLADADGNNVVALLQGDKRGLVVWSDPGTDATRLLADVVTATLRQSMRDDVLVRSALERVGSGAIQIAMAPAALKVIARRWLAGHLPAELIGERAIYAGLSVRRDASAGQTHLHLHVGAGQPGVSWLKATLDPTVALNATPLLDADATGGGVLRLNPLALARRADWLRRSPLVRRLLGALPGAPPKAVLAKLAPILTGQTLWQIGGGPTPWRLAAQLRPGGAGAAKVLVASDGDATVDATVEDGWLVWAPGAAGSAAQAAQDFKASLGLGDGIAEDRARLLTENQGFYLNEGASLPGLTAGPMQFEALWLHTGFVAHVTFPSPAAVEVR